MADVTISDLTTGVPSGSNFIPYTTSSDTNKTLVSSITAACQPVNYIGASITRATMTGVVANVNTDCNFNSPTFDSSGFYNNAVSNSRLTVPAGLGGIYLVTGYLTTSTTSAYYKNSIILVKNVSVIVRNDTSIGLNGVDVPMTTSAIVSLVAGDYIRLQGNCENFFNTNSFKTPTLSMIRLGT